MGPVAHATGRDISPSGLHYRRTCVEQRAFLPGVPGRREQEYIRSEDAYLKLPRITMNNPRQRPVDFRKP